MVIAQMSDVFFSLLTLTFLEIVLGIDNLVFISIITARLPASQRRVGRRFGLLFALITRLLLLAAVFWLTTFTYTLFHVFSTSISLRDLLLLCGGLFLLFKGTQEIHSEVVPYDALQGAPASLSLLAAIVQIGVFDIIFSLDSVITAIGMTQVYWVMALAITIAIAVMLWLSEPLSHFIEKNPTVKMLALSFLIMVGMVLVADGLHFHVPRGYLYFAICFSLFTETLNTLVRRRRHRR